MVRGVGAGFGTPLESLASRVADLRGPTREANSSRDDAREPDTRRSRLRRLGTAEVDINYGSNSDTHDVTVSSLNGTLIYSLPFNGNAQYYAADVTFTSPGSVSCKIIAAGPGVQPLTVSSGTATGGSNGSLCSAQTTPNDSQGNSWQNEQ